MNNNFNIKSLLYEYELENEIRKIKKSSQSKDKIIKDLQTKVEILQKNLENGHIHTTSRQPSVSISLDTDKDNIIISHIKSLSLIVQNIKTLFLLMNKPRNNNLVSDSMNPEVKNLFHETIKQQEHLEKIVRDCGINKIKKKLDDYEKEIFQLKLENVNLKEKITNFENKDEIVTTITKVSDHSSHVCDYPSSISINLEEYENETQQKIFKDEESKLQKEENGYKYQDVSFEILNSDILKESEEKKTQKDQKKDIFQTEHEKKDRSKILIKNETSLLQYSPMKEFYKTKNTVSNTLSDTMTENLKIVIEAISINLPISKWSKTLLICWMKNFLLFPQEIIPPCIDVVQAIDFEKFMLKTETKKYRKMNQFHLMKSLLAVQEVIELQKAELTSLERMTYFNKTMHHQWMSNYFLSHVGLGHLYSIFFQNLIDCRMLYAMDDKNFKHYLKVHCSFQRKCLFLAAHYLKSINFDRKKFEKIIYKELELVDELRFWSNYRFIKWLENYVNVKIILNHLQTSGICGFTIIHYSHVTSVHLKNILKKYFTRDVLETVFIEFNNLLKSHSNSAVNINELNIPNESHKQSKLFDIHKL